MNPSSLSRCLVFYLAPLALISAAFAAPLTGKALVEALQRGGYVILMRHASSPATPPEPARMESDNVKHERELDEAGRASARSMGEAFRQLRIRIGRVLSSPTYRALETGRLAALGPVQSFSELGDAGKSMSADVTGARGGWLRSKVAESPQPGTDTIIITHAPNIAEAYPREGTNLGDGEALIFHPDGRGGVALVARVKIEEWSGLADLR